MQTFKKDYIPFLLFVYFNDWIQYHCWLFFIIFEPNFNIVDVYCQFDIILAGVCLIYAHVIRSFFVVLCISSVKDV